MAPKKQASTETKECTIPWKKSREKEMLKKDIIDGVVREEMNPEQVYNMHAGYKKFKYVNFKQNLRSLHKTINRKKHAMIVGNVAFERFKRSAESYGGGNSTEQISWYNSKAKKLLASDIDAGYHLAKNPKEIWQSRQEYQEFELDKFRKYFYNLRQKMTRNEKMKARKQNKR